MLIQWRMSTGQTLPCVEKRFSTPEGKNSLFAVNKIICSAFVFSLYLCLICIFDRQEGKLTFPAFVSGNRAP